MFLIDETSVNPSGDYPITGFGGFYVTGWSTARRACNGENDPDPMTRLNGAIWGHYVKLVLASADGTPTTTPCNPANSAACIAVLVR